MQNDSQDVFTDLLSFLSQAQAAPVPPPASAQLSFFGSPSRASALLKTSDDDVSGLSTTAHSRSTTTLTSSSATTPLLATTQTNLFGNFPSLPAVQGASVAVPVQLWHSTTTDKMKSCTHRAVGHPQSYSSTPVPCHFNYQGKCRGAIIKRIHLCKQCKARFCDPCYRLALPNHNKRTGSRRKAPKRQLASRAPELDEEDGEVEEEDE